MALTVAAYQGHNGVVKTLLEHGADVNARGGWVSIVCSGGDVDIETLYLFSAEVTLY